ncbi:MAG TPA: VWA domain-containing protein [Pyrinomonadaceae bacterium]|jgi:VWFA-related protein/TonB family protein
MPRARARNLSARLLLLLCASLAFAQATSLFGQTQTPTPAVPTPTPYVRPRKVAPKVDAGGGQTAQPPATQPQPTPTQSAPTQPAPTPSAQPTRPADATPARPADADAGEVVDEDEVVRVDSNLVIIPASVVDARGRAITDLKVEDFELKVDGEVKPIGELTRAETPVHVALLFDNSASLSAAREFEKQAAVRFFKSVVRPIDRAAVYSISTMPTLAQGLTNDVPRLVRTIERFGKPDGATALFDTLAQAADYMRPLVGRKVLVLVSDGTDTVSDVNFDEAVNRALRAECQVYVVQTRQVEDPNLHDTVSEQRMYRITEQTGGAVFVPHSVEELDAVFTQISLDLSQQYLLSYYPQEERKDKYFRFISVRVKTRPALRVRARKGFYPDAAQVPQGGAKAGPANFSGGITSAPVPAVAAATTNEAAPYRRASAESNAPATARGAATPGRSRLGPDGPDTEEAAKTKQRADDSTATFTLTTSAPAPAAAPKTSNASSLFSAAPERAVANAAAETNSAANSVATNPAPEPAATPEPVPKAEAASAPAPVEESRGAKSDAGGESTKTVVSGGVLNTKALSLPVPNYPSAARSTGASGKVVVEVMIDEHGKIIEARAVSGHPFLQQAAVQAARLARFSPAKLSGEPVKVKGTINYVFTLP